jgi:crotonobetainyl-CoA:carnitine CoA-transferase CaiB-like acyl-CoA transferase
VATYYLAINRNKRSVVLDLKDTAGRATAAELARRADIMVQNFKPGGLAAYGLDYDSVRAGNPGIIYASITGFGTTGGAHLPGYDLVAQAVSGLMSLTGEADGPPQRAGISVIDVMTGLHTAIAILAALHHRAATGGGQHVEATLLGSALSGMVNQTSAYVAGGVVPFRMGNSHPSLTPYEPLPTADGELIVTAGNDRQFRLLCEVIGAPQLAGDPRFATTGARTTHRRELRTLLAERLATRPSAEWFGLLIAAGVPCGPINTVDAGVEFARGLGLRPVATAGAGADGVPTIRHPVGFSATPPDYPLPPPALDQHGDEIRGWLAAPPGPVPWRGGERKG